MNEQTAEELLDYAQAAVHIQRVYGGRKPSTNTLARWCIHGLKGVRLESVKRGSPRRVTRSAIAEFFRRLAEPPSQRHRVESKEQSRMEAELVRDGF